ncbi:hypothetical protein MRB53_012259 [Persea americana]|uniref:Uncharacterized protein n=1 Tax=Persea americana TaxID=3435 RepID=A0ACC2LWX6_PERAE|nr:hypothetical protein MRB53_012259 [Persea americana]
MLASLLCVDGGNASVARHGKVRITAYCRLHKKFMCSAPCGGYGKPQGSSPCQNFHGQRAKRATVNTLTCFHGLLHGSIGLFVVRGATVVDDLSFHHSRKREVSSLAQKGTKCGVW